MASREKRVIRKVKVRINPAKTIIDTSPVEERHPAPTTPPIIVNYHRRASLGPELERSMFKK